MTTPLSANKIGDMPVWLQEVDPDHRESLWASIQEANTGDVSDETQSRKNSSNMYYGALKKLGLVGK